MNPIKIRAAEQSCIFQYQKKPAKKTGWSFCTKRREELLSHAPATRGVKAFANSATNRSTSATQQLGEKGCVNPESVEVEHGITSKDVLFPLNVTPNCELSQKTRR